MFLNRGSESKERARPERWRHLLEQEAVGHADADEDLEAARGHGVHEVQVRLRRRLSAASKSSLLKLLSSLSIIYIFVIVINNENTSFMIILYY